MTTRFRQLIGRASQGLAKGAPALEEFVGGGELETRELSPLLVIEAILLLILILSLDTARSVRAQTSYTDPANEHACPSQTGAGGGAEAILSYVGPGSGFSPNQFYGRIRTIPRSQISRWQA